MSLRAAGQVLMAHGGRKPAKHAGLHQGLKRVTAMLRKAHVLAPWRVLHSRIATSLDFA